MEYVTFNVPKNKNCIIINTDRWLNSSSNLVQSQKMSGKLSVTCITEVIESQIPYINKGQKVLLSQVASDIAQYRKFQVEGENFYNIPESQIVGIFNDSITFEGLTIINDKVLIKKIDSTIESTLYLSQANVMVGEVVKVGTNVTGIHIGQQVLIRDNVSTEVLFGKHSYYATEERMIVGILHNSFNIEDIEFINKSILMKPYINSKVLNSSLLVSPDINYEDLDYSDMYNRNLFKVEFSDTSVKEIHKGDIILLNRDYTNYVYYGMEKYFTIDGTKYISAKIKE